MIRWVKKSIIVIYGIIMLLTVLTVMLDQYKVDYTYKYIFDIKNGYLLGGGVVITTFVVFVCSKYKEVIEKEIEKRKHFFSAILMLHFLMLVYICCNCYFKPGWDVEMVLDTASTLANGDTENISNWYYSRYPNNVLLTWVFSLVYKLNNKFGIYDTDNGIMLLVVLACVVQVFVGKLMFDIMYELEKSYIIAFGAWIVYFLFIGTSPWVLIPYSDSFGIVFPILGYRLYQKYREKKEYWLLSGVLAYIGYNIKPQTIIVLIAILGITTIRLNRKKLKKTIVHVLAFVLAFGVSGLIFTNVIFPNIGFDIDEENSMGLTHYLMMGLNNVSDGGYCHSDMLYSASFETKEERKKANIDMIRQRIQKMNEENTLLEHFQKKALVNFGDGTFAWGVEGAFIRKEYPDKNSFMSQACKQFIYKHGKTYHYLATEKQLIWIVLLVLSLGNVMYFFKINELDDERLICILSIIGIMLFVMLFEARARYLYIYSTCYIVLAFMGGKIFWFNKDVWRKLIKKKTDRRK